MKNKLLKLISAGILVASFSSQAALIGVFGNSTAQASQIATGLGLNIEVISDFTNLNTYDLVWGLNSSNGNHLSELTNNVTEFDNYVLSGGTFLYHDRYVSDSGLFIPGADNFDFIRSPVDNIDLVSANAIAQDTITNSSLDNQNSSNHGYVNETSIDRSFTGIFNNGNEGQLVDLTYGYGEGDVYYSSIPLDAFLTRDIFSESYVPNVLSFNLGLFEEIDTVEVSEPTGIVFLSLALITLGFYRKRV